MQAKTGACPNISSSHLVARKKQVHHVHGAVEVARSCPKALFFILLWLHLHLDFAALRKIDLPVVVESAHGFECERVLAGLVCTIEDVIPDPLKTAVGRLQADDLAHVKGVEAEGCVHLQGLAEPNSFLCQGEAFDQPAFTDIGNSVGRGQRPLQEFTHGYHDLNRDRNPVYPRFRIAEARVGKDCHIGETHLRPAI